MNAENGAGLRCLSGSNSLWIYISLFMEIRVGVFTLSINLDGPEFRVPVKTTNGLMLRLLLLTFLQKMRKENTFANEPMCRLL